MKNLGEIKSLPTLKHKFKKLTEKIYSDFKKWGKSPLDNWDTHRSFNEWRELHAQLERVDKEWLEEYLKI